MNRAEADFVEKAGSVGTIESLEIAMPRSSSASTSKGVRWKAALIHEVRTHPFGYAVLAVALVAGPFLIRLIFPEVSPVQAIVGGVAFGIYGALCAVPQKFM